MTVVVGTGAVAGSSVFDVEPARIVTLAVGETREVTLWAFPRETHLYTNTVVCTIKDNTTPLQFPVSCLGKPNGKHCLYFVDWR